MADLRDDDQEAQILTKLTKGPTNHPGKSSLCQLLDQFDLEGPNGRHSCLVSDALGPGIWDLNVPADDRWHIARQLVQAIVYCHDLGIVHGGMFSSSFRSACTIIGYSRLEIYRFTPIQALILQYQINAL